MAEIEAARCVNKDKQIEARLKVFALRADGKSLSERSKRTEYHRSHVNGLIRQYFGAGITSVTQKHSVGNHRNMGAVEESARFWKLISPANGAWTFARCAGTCYSLRGEGRAPNWELTDIPFITSA